MRGYTAKVGLRIPKSRAERDAWEDANCEAASLARAHRLWSEIYNMVRVTR